MGYNPSSFYHIDFYSVPDSIEPSPADLAEHAKNENNPGNTRPDSKRKLYNSLAPPDEFLNSR